MRHPREAPRARRWSPTGAPIAAGAIAVVASACGFSSSNPPISSAAPPAATGSAGELLTAGLNAQSAGDLSTATFDYQRVIQAAPSSSYAAYANYDLGEIAQVDNNDTSAAASYYRASLALNPNFESALYNLAIIVTGSQPQQALDYYQQVVAIDPKNANAHLNEGFIYVTLGNHARAVNQFHQATNLNPSLLSRVPPGDTPPTT